MTGPAGSHGWPGSNRVLFAITAVAALTGVASVVIEERRRREVNDRQFVSGGVRIGTDGILSRWNSEIILPVSGQLASQMLDLRAG